MTPAGKQPSRRNEDKHLTVADWYTQDPEETSKLRSTAITKAMQLSQARMASSAPRERYMVKEVLMTRSTDGGLEFIHYGLYFGEKIVDLQWKYDSLNNIVGVRCDLRTPSPAQLSRWTFNEIGETEYTPDIAHAIGRSHLENAFLTTRGIYDIIHGWLSESLLELFVFCQNFTFCIGSELERECVPPGSAPRYLQIFPGTVAALLPNKMYSNTRAQLEAMAMDREEDDDFFTENIIAMQAAEATRGRVLSTAVAVSGAVTLLAILKKIVACYQQKPSDEPANEDTEAISTYVTRMSKVGDTGDSDTIHHFRKDSTKGTGGRKPKVREWQPSD